MPVKIATIWKFNFFITFILFLSPSTFASLILLNQMAGFNFKNDFLNMILWM